MRTSLTATVMVLALANLVCNQQERAGEARLRSARRVYQRRRGSRRASQRPGSGTRLGEVIPQEPAWIMKASRASLFALVALLAGCGSSNSLSPTASSTGTMASPTPVPTAAPTTTPAPTLTPTPVATCELSVSSAAFDPARVNCPVGTSIQTMRLVFDLTASNGPITINRVSTSGSRCQSSFGTCTFPDGPLSFSPSIVPSGTTARIAATTRFTCGSNGNPRDGAQIFVDKLFVNTSCGAAREIVVTNSFVIGS